MTESTQLDKPRAGWSELIKRWLVRGYAAALVGGAPQRRYLTALGMNADAVFTGYDAVDNDYFRSGAAAARADAEQLRRQFNLPRHYFLCCSRFVAEKNLATVLKAFALCRQDAACREWQLVLVGDGPLRTSLESMAADLGLGAAVHWPGFVQYWHLPTYYGLAGVFVHASTSEPWGLVVNEAMASGLPAVVSNRCGCAEDLVIDDVTGFQVAPDDTESLAARLQMLAASATLRARLGAAASAHVELCAPQAFARGLWQAVALAERAPPRRRRGRILRGMILRALTRR